jgi:hypothetical protein
MALIEQSPAARHTLDLPRLQNLLDTWPESGYETSEVAHVWHLALTRAISVGYFLRSHEPALAGTPAGTAPSLAARLI